MDSYESYNGITLPIYISFYKNNKGLYLGLMVAIDGPKKSFTFRKSFPFKNFDKGKTLEAAIEFTKTDKEFLKIKGNRNNKSTKIGFDESIKYYCEQFKIDKFPAKIGENRFIGIDKVGNQYYFIRECTKCKKHSNVQISQLHKSLNGLCRDCMIQTNYFGRKYKYLQYYYLDKEKTRMIFTCKLTTKRILYFNKNIKAKDFELPFEEVIKIYKEYLLFLIDDFIIKNNLHFMRNLDSKTFTKFRTKYAKLPIIIKTPKLHVNKEFLDDYRLKMNHHLFRAKIQGFSINKKNGTKTVLLNNVEYIGIDNFRDHMWTIFTEELNLPVGTNIKFKGEIYEYEKDYQGLPDDKIYDHAIKIVELLEVDTSARQRTKL